jgi:hypothetical protein
VVRGRGRRPAQMVRPRPTAACVYANVRRHWPIGLIYDTHHIAATVRPTAGALPVGQTAPLRLVLHLASPPTDKLLLAPSADACKAAFMGQLKEADFIRWGNTKRMTGLRKAEQDSIWEGIRKRASSSPTLLPHVLPFLSRGLLLRRDIRGADNFDD